MQSALWKLREKIDGLQPRLPILVASRLGGWKDDEAVASAYARALALEPRDLLVALQSRGRADLNARHAKAVHRLFGEVGVNMDNPSAEHLAKAIDKMVAELPGFLMPMAAYDCDRFGEQGEAQQKRKVFVG